MRVWPTAILSLFSACGWSYTYTVYYDTDPNYPNFAGEQAALSALCTANPSWSCQTFGYSAQGNPISGIIVHGSSYSLTVLIDANMHGSEKATGKAALDFLSYLSAHTALYPSIRLIVIPIHNPDGFNAVLRTNNNTPAGRAVDLNRNHSPHWGQAPTFGSPPSSDPASDHYMGPYADSEPETMVMQSVAVTYHPQFHINLHQADNTLYIISGNSLAPANWVRAALPANGFEQMRDPTGTLYGAYSDYTYSTLGIPGFEWEMGGRSLHEEVNRFICGMDAILVGLAAGASQSTLVGTFRGTFQ